MRGSICYSRWDEARIERVLERLVKDGRAWVDEQATDTVHYWFPSLFLEQYSHLNSDNISGSTSSATY